MNAEKYLPRLLLALACLMLLAGLLTGGLSPAGILKSVADRFVADGDFETIDAAFYNQLRPVFLVAGLWLIGLWFFLQQSRKFEAKTWPRLAVGTAAAGAFVLLIGAGSLAVQRLQSPVYRYLLNEQTPTPTLTPTASPVPPATIVPTATPVPRSPGSWTQIASGLGPLTLMAEPGDGSGRLFVGSQGGLIWIIRDGQVLDPPFLDLRDRSIQDFGIEQGLLGLAFHPDYTENGYFYVDYIDVNGNTVVSRFKVSEDDPDRADPDSEYRLFGILQPDPIHNGGQMAFGPDGYLYISAGDGGPQRDPFGTAQSLDIMLGKILRIDVDSAEPYGIPPDNPFVGKAGLDEILHYGLRNPWRFSFDALTGDLYIGEVGHNAFEEIDFIPAGSPGGLNFGWSIYEGFAPYTGKEEPPASFPKDPVMPVWIHDHSGGGFCAIVGGYVYRGSALPDLQGIYIYGDYCRGNIYGLSRDADGNWQSEFLFDSGFLITSFGIDSDNEIYLLTKRGEVYKLVP